MRKLLALLLLLGAAPAFATTYYAVSGTAVDATGSPLVSPTVSVYSLSTNALATIYSDNSGSSQANPFTAGSDGTYSIYATSGRYRIDSRVGSGTTYSRFVTVPVTTPGLASLKNTCHPDSGGQVVEFATDGTASCIATPSGGGGGGGSGTVTSVALTVPSWLTVSGSPVTSSGTLAVTATSGQTANRFLATPNGSTGTVGLRAIVAADVPTLNQSTTGSAATLTTPRAIYGNSFDGSAALTQVIASTYGGTGNGFTKFSGPTTSEKTFTLPDASATILTSNAAVTVAQGGTGTSSLAAHGVVVGNGTSAVSVTGAGTSGQVLTSNGASADPTFQTLSAVTGPGSSTDKAIPTFNGTGGATLQNNSGVTIPSAGVVQASTLQGGTASGGNLTLNTTSDTTKGTVYVDGSTVGIQNDNGNLDLVTGSTQRWKVHSSLGDIYAAGGNVQIIGGTSNCTTPGFTFEGDLGTGIGYGGSGVTCISAGGVAAMKFSSDGHQVLGGSAPSVAGSCGTSPSIAGVDGGFKITTGSGSPTSCQVTFHSSWSTAPVCLANASTTTTPLNVATTTTTVTVSAAALTAAETIFVQCKGY